MDEMPGAGDRVHGERAQRVGQLDQLGRPRSAAVGHAAQHQQHGTRDRRETRLEPLPLARRGHGKVAPQRAIEVARGAGRVAVHHAVTDPRRIGRQGDQVCADLLADHADAAEQLDPGRELHRPAHPRRRRRLDGPALERDHRPHQIRPPVCEPIGDRRAGGVGDDHRPRHTELIERAGDPVGLSGERIVGVLGPPRVADAERLDHDGAITRLRQARDDLPIGERRSEQAGDEHDRGAGLGSRHGDLHRLGTRQHQRKRVRAVGHH